MRKIVLFAGVAGVLAVGAAVAQEPLAQQAPTAQAQSAGAVTLTPGATVRGSDGVLGTLVGVQTGASGEQELTVRGSDGQVRAVPLGGFRQDGSDIVVGWSTAEYAAAPIIGAGAATSAARPAAPSAAPSAAMGATPPATTSRPVTNPAPDAAPAPGADNAAGSMDDEAAAPDAGDMAQPSQAPDASTTPPDDGSGS